MILIFVIGHLMPVTHPPVHFEQVVGRLYILYGEIFLHRIDPG